MTVEKKNSILFLKKLYNRFISVSENFILHFSEIEKVGINPKTAHQSTPLGVYGYTLKSFFEVYKGDIKKLPFANKRKYIHILYMKPGSKKFVIDKKGNVYTNDNVIEKIEQKLGLELSDNKNRRGIYTEIVFEIRERLNYPPNLGSVLGNFFRKTGIDIIIDNGSGQIFTGEPYQVVIVDPTSYKLVKTLFNPLV